MPLAARWHGTRGLAVGVLSFCPRRAPEFPAQPGAGRGPAALGGGHGDIERFGDFIEIHAAEKVHLDQARLLGVEFGEPAEGLIDREHLVGALFRHRHDVFQGDRARAVAPFRGLAATGMVHQDAAHEEGGDSQELRAVLAIRQTLVDHAEIGFMDEGGGLERMLAPFPLEVSFGYAMQFGIDQGEQVVKCRSVALADTSE